MKRMLRRAALLGLASMCTVGVMTPTNAQAANQNWWNGFATGGVHWGPGYSPNYTWQTIYINAGLWTNYLDSCAGIDYSSGSTGVSPNNVSQPTSQGDTRVRFTNHNGTSQISAWTGIVGLETTCPPW